eukprot:TRINITY_DN6952_c0_g2_i1.p1 TRINITY_DN6952_c0_g2~~TRINITY_DN6952_c0_g2_i1.p1  ORF type:complete len:1057 (+),score=281.65 TRINITY_DN6952_c0_g2_i1:50-3220(+)
MRPLQVLLVLAGAASADIRSFGPSATSVLSSVYLEIDDEADLVTLDATGPADKWFSIGFGSQSMKDTYAVVVTPASLTGGATLVEEYKLGDHTLGIRLSLQWAVGAATVSGSTVQVRMTRPRAGATANHFSFWPADSLEYINAVGNSNERPGVANPTSAHSPRAGGVMPFTLSPKDLEQATPRYLGSPGHVGSPAGQYMASPRGVWEDSPAGQLAATPGSKFDVSPLGKFGASPQGKTEATPAWDVAPVFLDTPLGKLRASPAAVHATTPAGQWDASPLGQAQYAPGAPRSVYVASPLGEWRASPVSTPRGQWLETPTGSDSTPVGDWRRAPAQLYAESPLGKWAVSPAGIHYQVPEFRTEPAYALSPRGEQLVSPGWDTSPEGRRWGSSPQYLASPKGVSYVQSPKWDRSPTGQTWAVSPAFLASPKGTEFRGSPLYDLAPTSAAWRQTPAYDRMPATLAYRETPQYYHSPDWKGWLMSPEWDMTPEGWQRRLDARAFKGLAPLFLNQPSQQLWAAAQTPDGKIPDETGDDGSSGAVIAVVVVLCVVVLVALGLLLLLSKKKKAAAAGAEERPLYDQPGRFDEEEAEVVELQKRPRAGPDEDDVVAERTAPSPAPVIHGYSPLPPPAPPGVLPPPNPRAVGGSGSGSGLFGAPSVSPLSSTAPTGAQPGHPPFRPVPSRPGPGGPPPGAIRAAAPVLGPAAPPPPPPGPPPDVVMRLGLPGPEAFNQPAFQRSVAAGCGVPPNSVQILRVAPGSVIVAFRFVNVTDPHGCAKRVVEAAQGHSPDTDLGRLFSHTYPVLSAELGDTPSPRSRQALSPAASPSPSPQPRPPQLPPTKLTFRGAAVFPPPTRLRQPAPAARPPLSPSLRQPHVDVPRSLPAAPPVPPTPPSAAIPLPPTQPLAAPPPPTPPPPPAQLAQPAQLQQLQQAQPAAADRPPPETPRSRDLADPPSTAGAAGAALRRFVAVPDVAAEMKEVRELFHRVTSSNERRASGAPRGPAPRDMSPPRRRPTVQLVDTLKRESVRRAAALSTADDVDAGNVTSWTAAVRIPPSQPVTR